MKRQNKRLYGQIDCRDKEEVHINGDSIWPGPGKKWRQLAKEIGKGEEGNLLVVSVCTNCPILFSFPHLLAPKFFNLNKFNAKKLNLKMDANAWSLVEEDENAAETAEEEIRVEKALIAAALEEARKSSSAVAASRSASTTGGGRHGSEGALEETHSAPDERGPADFCWGLETAADKKRRRSKSPAVESLRRFGQLVMDRVKRRRSTEPMAVPLAKTKELPPFPLDGLCQRPRQFYRKGPEWGERKVVSGKLLDDEGGGGRRLNKEKERCAHLFRPTDHSHLVDALAGAEVPMRIHVYDPFCPVHGSRRRLRHAGGIRGHRLVDMHSIFASVESAADGDEEEKLNPYLLSQAILAKQFRKERRALLREMEGPKLKELKKGILADLGILSLAFLFLFTGFNGLQMLQTSVNDQLGADALCVLYASLAISTLFVPPYLLNRVGCKRTLVIAIGLHSLYFCANFIPKYYSLIPASILAGAAGSCLWAAKCVYIVESAVKYAKLNVESSGTVIPRFFGFFFMFYHVGQVLGNLLSSLILGASMERMEAEDRVDYTCGHTFFQSNLSERAQQNLSPPSRPAFLAVVGIDLFCSLLALLTVKMFLNPLLKQTTTLAVPPSTQGGAQGGQASAIQQLKFSADIFHLSLKNLSRPKPLLLIPLTVFNGIEQAFAVGLYTKAYAGCALGISEIGYVMASFGLADAICSLVFGPLIKLFGRMPLLMFGAVINLLMIVTLMIWAVNPGDRVLFNAVAGVWGMADGVWNTQLNGFWVAILGPGRDQLEVAFANYRFWMSFGLALGFLLIRATTIDNFLLIAFAFLLVGILGYFMVELFDIIAIRLQSEEERERMAAMGAMGGTIRGQKQSRSNGPEKGATVETGGGVEGAVSNTSTTAAEENGTE